MNASYDDRSYDEFAETRSESNGFHRAGLMVALLLDYPELARVRVRPQKSLLTLAFLLQSPLAPESFHSLQQRVSLSLRSLSFLEGRTVPRQVYIHQRQEGSLTVLELDRDLPTVSDEEFPVLIDSVIQMTQGVLIVEEGDESSLILPPDDTVTIAENLDSTDVSPADIELVGVRDAGRVLVFCQG